MDQLESKKRGKQAIPIHNHYVRVQKNKSNQTGNTLSMNIGAAKVIFCKGIFAIILRSHCWHSEQIGK
jgi:hypothetical protein